MATELQHFGVKGMRWGVRKRYDDIRNRPLDTLVLKSKKGEIVTVKEDRPSVIASILGAVSPKHRESMKDSKMIGIEVNGVSVGTAALTRRSKSEMYFGWIDVDPAQRGKGYASAVFDAGIVYAKKNGAQKITLEVPSNAPDARHIYEKRGFKVTKEPSSAERKSDIVFGGLYSMELNLTRR